MNERSPRLPAVQQSRPGPAQDQTRTECDQRGDTPYTARGPAHYAVDVPHQSSLACTQRRQNPTTTHGHTEADTAWLHRTSTVRLSTTAPVSKGGGKVGTATVGRCGTSGRFDDHFSCCGSCCDPCSLSVCVGSSLHGRHTMYGSPVVECGGTHHTGSVCSLLPCASTSGVRQADL